jgi:hypothetical protein
MKVHLLDPLNPPLSEGDFTRLRIYGQALSVDLKTHPLTIGPVA